MLRSPHDTKTLLSGRIKPEKAHRASPRFDVATSFSFYFRLDRISTSSTSSCNGSVRLNWFPCIGKGIQKEHLLYLEPAYYY